jgi:hypothetical protein
MPEKGELCVIGGKHAHRCFYTPIVNKVCVFSRETGNTYQVFLNSTFESWNIHPEDFIPIDMNNDHAVKLLNKEEDNL